MNQRPWAIIHGRCRYCGGDTATMPTRTRRRSCSNTCRHGLSLGHDIDHIAAQQRAWWSSPKASSVFVQYALAHTHTHTQTHARKLTSRPYASPFPLNMWYRDIFDKQAGTAAAHRQNEEAHIRIVCVCVCAHVWHQLLYCPTQPQPSPSPHKGPAALSFLLALGFSPSLSL